MGRGRKDWSELTQLTEIHSEMFVECVNLPQENLTKKDLTRWRGEMSRNSISFPAINKLV